MVLTVGLFRRHESQDPIVVARRATASIAIGSSKVDVSIRPFRDITNAAVLPFQQILLTYNLPSIRDDTNNPLPDQTAKKEISFELRKLRTAIERAAPGRARRRVLEHG